MIGGVIDSHATVYLSVSAIIDSMTVHGRIVSSDGATLGTFDQEVEVARSE